MTKANSPARRTLVLVMRRGLSTSPDHVQTMLDLDIRTHLLTVDTEPWANDPRFASVRRLPHDADQRAFVRAAVEIARDRDASAVVTFIEPDIEIVEEANAELGLDWAIPESARVCRDKLRQRMFLAEHDIPSVWFHPVTDIESAVEAATAHGLPVMVKPTRAAASDCVELVHDPDRLRASLKVVQSYIESGRNFYFSGAPESWAVLEDYLPGEEVTLDGVVLDGRFVLGGVHNKKHSTGPHFEEDLYTLPFRTPEHEAEVAGIAADITRRLGVKHGLFNAELRQDAQGRYRVVEFSIRVSGGHVYRHIKDVYAIDIVRMFLRAACGESAADILAQENAKQPPRMTVSAKVIYRNGRVVRNSVGEAMHSPYFRTYFPVAKPGTDVVSGENGFDFTGLLSVWHPWEPGQDPAVVHEVARSLAEMLDVEVAEPAGTHGQEAP
ncbi:acetyl-CoA carboxylase biotin carboxylase subunit family protein [Streptomyces sp. NPDC096152]|uniref:ATP-grasp domain-containing protein n=1 Tax=Streptomyces sp. NPDC096152 TaxID=3366078 RepID=UPI00380AF82E